MIGHKLGASVMMQLGSFQFGISTAAYQELTRRSGYRWPGQDRFGVEPALQFTGPESEAISLSGTIYTEYRGGVGQLNTMRSLAARGRPLNLVDGSGRMLGRWVIESVEEKQTVFANAGMPRKQEFSLQLKKFPGEAPGAVNKATTAATAAAGAAAKVAAPAANTVAGAKTAVGKFVEGATSTIGNAVKTMNTTLAAVKEKAAEIGNAVAPVVATVARGISTARALQNQVQGLKDSMQNLNSLANIQSALGGVMSTASAASNAGAFAADAAKSLGIQIDLPSADPSTVQAVKDCGLACGRAAVTAAGIYSDADNLVKSITSVGN